MENSNPRSTRLFFTRGEPFVWCCAVGFVMILAMVFWLFGVIFSNAVGVFWPKTVYQYTLKNGSDVIGELVADEWETAQGETKQKLQIKIGNREINGLDFKWLNADDVNLSTTPSDIMVLERLENGAFFGRLKQFDDLKSPINLTQADFLKTFQKTKSLKSVVRKRSKELEATNRRLNQETLNEKKAYYSGEKSTDGSHAKSVQDLQELQTKFQKELESLTEARSNWESQYAIFTDAAGSDIKIRYSDIVRFYHPNSMGLFDKIKYYGVRILELLFDEPRESNTEGGLFPAIFGTIMLILIMSVLCFPLGVLAGIYLREYAKEGLLVTLVRIAVNNLAGIPAIVFGIFGLGFFIYGVGGEIDQLFFADRLPDPTFGTGGILWASLTLGLLTIPVVIVATEEALSAIPSAYRENSYALGATKFQTLWRISLPAASSGILTGFILAMARAAGEVAPLMITGVVKLAKDLPLDGNWPFFHPEVKFMHLGFHIYDISFQSPNVEAAKPMVYVTTMLLLLIVVVLSSVAIYLREQLKKKYRPQGI